ncbi:MAG: class I mannose-6-phosphate isomerase [Planctomycetes bacterium]|nr:class I mannose-6-phosphate isomerase [Planctomycetota bacterium]
MLPIVLGPLLKHRVWGGTRICPFLKLPDPPMPIGEAWLVADLPPSRTEGASPIVAGHGTGSTLKDVMAAERDLVLGRAAASPSGDFPLLVKLLDADEPLSVQVHPNAAYAQAHPDCFMKSEAWLVLEARADATLYRGIRREVDAAAFRRHLDDGGVIDDLVRERVRPGQTYWLPSGICHALGAGMMVAEYQTPSDTTFRVYDWDRNDPARPLHLEQAMECILFGDDQALNAPDDHEPWRACGGSWRGRTRVRTPFFRVDELEAPMGATADMPERDTPTVWTLTSGTARLSAGAWQADLAPGASFILPAASSGCRLLATEPVALLVATLPDALRGHDDRTSWHLA